MNWDHVRFFLALHRSQSLSGAANVLNVNHATVGRRIGALEDQLGASVFIKTPDGYFLTPFGESMLPAALDAERAFNRLSIVTRNVNESPTGTVRVATSPLLSRHMLVPATAELREHHPGVVVNVLEGSKFLDLSRQEADIALRLQMRQEVDAASAVRVRHLGMMGWALFALPEAPWLASEGPLPVVPFNDAAPGRPGSDWLHAHRDEVRIVMKSSSMYTCTRAILAGIGAAFILTAQGRALGLEQLSDTVHESHAYVVVHPDLRNDARIRIVFDHLVDYAARNPELFDQPT